MTAPAPSDPRRAWAARIAEACRATIGASP